MAVIFEKQKLTSYHMRSRLCTSRKQTWIGNQKKHDTSVFLMSLAPFWMSLVFTKRNSSRIGIFCMKHFDSTIPDRSSFIFRRKHAETSAVSMFFVLAILSLLHLLAMIQPCSARKRRWNREWWFQKIFSGEAYVWLVFSALRTQVTSKTALANQKMHLVAFFFDLQFICEHIDSVGSFGIELFLPFYEDLVFGRPYERHLNLNRNLFQRTTRHETVYPSRGPDTLRCWIGHISLQT